MEKLKINYFIDVLMTISFLVVAVTGLVLFFVLPEGVQRGGYREFLGLIKSTWISIHDWSGIILIILVVLHFILHWDCMVVMTKKVLFRKK